MNNHIKMRTDLSGWGADLQKLLLLLLATQDLTGQDPSMDPRAEIVMARRHEGTDLHVQVPFNIPT
jgi:hypothetical protein